jgi:hypothetical protein
LVSAANNTFHLWLATTFNGGTIITEETLQSLPPGMQDIFQLIKQCTPAIYLCEPLPSGKDWINILQHNLCQYQLTPLSSNFKDTIAGWYCNLLFSGDYLTDSTGIENHLFVAYSLNPSEVNS